ncbi:helix-turn-helix transcriptional regulator [Streptomyces sp. NPDC089795]|uniref:helix-turn-helix domain-containing protein n=1 Tax=Streptomyces sp. NPDC089795 TaxID=3155297 RepID=UPI00342BD4F3
MQRAAGVRDSDLGKFLQVRRSLLTPDDIGLPGDGKRRRVRGLRREEVAHIAQVSVNYYTRLEQGQNRSASPEVLDAIANALRLNPGERAHLHNLSRAAELARPAKAAEEVRPAVARMISAYLQGPAVVLGRQMDILAWNALARTMFSGHIDIEELLARDAPPNLAELVFLHPGARALYPRWNDEAVEMAGYLRMMAGRFPGDAELVELIERLCLASPEFTEIWSGHVVWDKTFGTRHLHHPAVGELTLAFESLRLPDSPDQCIVLYHAEPASLAEEALRVLLEGRGGG